MTLIARFSPFVHRRVLTGLLAAAAVGCAGADDASDMTAQSSSADTMVPCVPVGGAEPCPGPDAPVGSEDMTAQMPTGAVPVPATPPTIDSVNPGEPPPAPTDMSPTDMEDPMTMEPVDEPATEPVDEPVAMEPVDEPVAMEPVDEPMEPAMEPETPVEEPTDPSDPVDIDPTEVPAIAYCEEVAEWDPMWSQWEEEVLLIVNENRAAGANCGSEGDFDPAGPLTMDPLLRCTARVHSLDMYTRGFFDHTNPDGDGPGERLDAAEYNGSTWGENIAQGYQDPQEVMEGWMDSDGHCSNLMNDSFTLIGVGYHPGEGGRGDSHFWTQNFGAAPRQR